jgi:uncharacterized protein (TIGR02118 family)
MIKLVCCFAKKPNMTDEPFFNYWKDIHGPIGSRIPGLRKLVQSHRISVPGDSRPHDFDGLADISFPKNTSLSRWANPCVPSTLRIKRARASGGQHRKLATVR